jgi:hypothetical protein
MKGKGLISVVEISFKMSAVEMKMEDTKKEFLALPSQYDNQQKRYKQTVKVCT